MKRIPGFASLFASLAFAVAFSASGQEGAKPSWHMKGELEESCSCDAACPCWWGSHPTKMTCSGGQVLFIEKGNYGDVPLDGLAIAQFAQSPEGKTMAESMGDWNFGYFYVDAKADAKQRAALEAIARQTFPPIPADRVKVRYVPITRSKEGETHRVTLGQYGSFSAHLLPGGMGGAPRISNPPLAEPIHKEWSQGVTDKQAYDDAKKWDFANTNYMFGSFDVTNSDYEKFAADMEKAMAAKKK
jgi:hypothetical protein